MKKKIQPSISSTATASNVIEPLRHLRKEEDQKQNTRSAKKVNSDGTKTNGDLYYPSGSHDPRGATEIMRGRLSPTNEVVCMPSVHADLDTDEWGRVLARSINAISMALDENGDAEALVDEILSSLNMHLEKDEEEEEI
jgi:hypothetical protein